MCPPQATWVLPGVRGQHCPAAWTFLLRCKAECPITWSHTRAWGPTGFEVPAAGALQVAVPAGSGSWVGEEPSSRDCPSTLSDSCTEVGSSEWETEGRQRQSWGGFQCLPPGQGHTAPQDSRLALCHHCSMDHPPGHLWAGPRCCTVGWELRAQQQGPPAHEFFMPLFGKWESGGLPLSSAVKQ